MPLAVRPFRLALASLLIATAAQAAAPPSPDFSGAWRLDDRNSDSADTLTASLRNEARNELQASTTGPASASSAAPPAGAHGAGGHHGGGGMGGAGGGGMGHGGGTGGGGGMGGGHGHHGGGDSESNKPATPDKDPIATATYPMPPILKTDSVLLVQQDAKTFEIRLNDGTRFTGKLDNQERQSLNGNAMVRGRLEQGRMVLSIQYQDGTRLEQNWALTPDGQQMIVTGAWKVPTLEQPVTYKRTYVGLH